jgi:hypothetical protein
MTENEIDEFEVEGQQQQPISLNVFRQRVRLLIDVGLQSGLNAEDLQEELDDLSNGVPYYAEDMMRYTQQQQENED